MLASTLILDCMSGSIAIHKFYNRQLKIKIAEPVSQATLTCADLFIGDGSVVETLCCGKIMPPMLWPEVESSAISKARNCSSYLKVVV